MFNFFKFWFKIWNKVLFENRMCASILMFSLGSRAFASGSPWHWALFEPALAPPVRSKRLEHLGPASVLPVRSKWPLRPASLLPVLSKRLFAPAVWDHRSKKQFSVALCLVLCSASLRNPSKWDATGFVVQLFLNKSLSYWVLKSADSLRMILTRSHLH